MYSRSRLIPARAGSTALWFLLRRVPAVHPRSCGERTHLTDAEVAHPGSSPLARGTRNVNRLQAVEARLIPARAGNTTGKFHPGGKGTAHPRSRGEHGETGGIEIFAFGSSPLARGTLGFTRNKRHKLRLIPARAGNTSSNALAAFFMPAHPRSRGEHSMNAAVSGSCIGSSPLARGTQSACRRLQAEVWLIPARAGNTSIAWLRACIRSAHPRSRGEHRGLNPRYIQKCGSSPLVRGTCTHQRNQPLLVRLIPARAGNTSRQSASCSWPRAHPRSRGEHGGGGGE